MPRINSRWRADADRARYYRLRADKLEMELAEAKQNLLPAEKIESDLRAFCSAIEARVRKRQISAELQKELAEDLGDFLHKISVNGKSDTKRRPLAAAGN